MLRKQARHRREYLYKKSFNERLLKSTNIDESINERIQLNKSLNRSIGTDFYDKFKYGVKGSGVPQCLDEYHYAGCEDPKIMLTTSHEPSSRLKMFMKELRLVLPNAQQINRGKYQINTLIHACLANKVTDFIIVHEHRGIPDSLVICHLPHGPTSFFNISEVIMRHDIPDISPMSEQKPHLIFGNFKSQLGIRTMTILKHLFPVPKEKKTNRVISFINNEDHILFRHHVFEYENSELQLKEIGPRFQLKLYQIKLGTLENLKAAPTEWVYRPYLNTSVKKRVLSDDSICSVKQ